MSRNVIDPGSFASSTWAGNQIPGDPNHAPVSFSASSPGKLAFQQASSGRHSFRFGATAVSQFRDVPANGNPPTTPLQTSTGIADAYVTTLSFRYIFRLDGSRGVELDGADVPATRLRTRGP